MDANISLSKTERERKNVSYRDQWLGPQAGRLLLTVAGGDEASPAVRLVTCGHLCRLSLSPPAPACSWFLSDVCGHS